MTITDVRPVAAASSDVKADIPTHLPWCTEHWEDTEPGGPGVCFADDLVIQAGSGTFEVMASQTPGAAPSLTLYLPGRDIVTAQSFNSLAEAETAARAILGMVARLSGDEQLAQVHLSAAASSGEDGS